MSLRHPPASLLSSLAVAVSLAFTGCGAEGTSKADVDAAAAKHDPAKLSLGPGGNAYAERKLLPDGIETGIITLGDGEQVKYWFKSHHLGNDIGCTRFEFIDGTAVHLHGCFCCEVLLPDARLADRKALERFVAARDGQSP